VDALSVGFLSLQNVILIFFLTSAFITQSLHYLNLKDRTINISFDLIRLIFIPGGQAHGPRSPKTHYYMLHKYKRIRGLTSVLSAKLAQDDLHIVDSLDIPSDETAYLLDLAKHRLWGPSVLFVDE